MKLTNPFVVLIALAALVVGMIAWSGRGDAEADSGAAGALDEPDPEPLPPVEPEPAPEPSVEDRAIEMVTERLKDPLSAQFRAVQSLPEKNRVCGQVNARNAMGGYVGYQWFTVMTVGSGDKVVLIDSPGTHIAAAACETAHAR